MTFSCHGNKWPSPLPPRGGARVSALPPSGPGVKWSWCTSESVLIRVQVWGLDSSCSVPVQLLYTNGSPSAVQRPRDLLQHRPSPASRCAPHVSRRWHSWCTWRRTPTCDRQAAAVVSDESCFITVDVRCDVHLRRKQGSCCLLFTCLFSVLSVYSASLLLFPFAFVSPK